MNRPRRGLSSPIILGAVCAVTLFWLYVVPLDQAPLLKTATGTESNENKKIIPPTVLATEKDSTKFWNPNLSPPPFNDGRDVTIVSGYFNLAKMGQKTKHEASFYLMAGREGVLNFDSLLVMFTDSPREVQDLFSKFAPSTARLHIVNISLYDFDIVKSTLKKVTEYVRRDGEAIGAGYSGLLFSIYHAKAEMMRRAAEMNVFQTHKFLWMDVGSVRTWGGIYKDDFKHKRFPPPSMEKFLGREDKILMGAVAGRDGPCIDNVRWVSAWGDRPAVDPKVRIADPLDVPATTWHWWIAGAIWGGPGSQMRAYELLYKETLERYLSKDLPNYSLIDQYIMGALACSSSMIEVAKPPLECCVDRVNRMWFFMLMFLNDKEIPTQPYYSWEKRNPGLNSCKYCKPEDIAKPT